MPRAFSESSASTVHSMLAAGTLTIFDSLYELVVSCSLPSMVWRFTTVQWRSYGIARYGLATVWRLPQPSAMPATASLRLACRSATRSRIMPTGIMRTSARAPIRTVFTRSVRFMSASVAAAVGISRAKSGQDEGEARHKFLQPAVETTPSPNVIVVSGANCPRQPERRPPCNIIADLHQRERDAERAQGSGHSDDQRLPGLHRGDDQGGGEGGKQPPAADVGCHHGARAERQGVGAERAVRRDQGAARRLLPS